MKKRTLIALAIAAGLQASGQVPLRGFSYGRLQAPTGDEWQQVEAYAHGKEQPHATFYSFGKDESALRVLPEHSQYVQSLDGKWRFHWVGNPEERPTDFYQTSYNDSQWDLVDVPMSWNVYGLQKDGSQKYGTPIYVNQPLIFWHEVKVDDWRGGVMRTPPTNWTTYKHRNEVGSYRRTFTVPQHWDGRAVYINFDGVDSFFYLWINGQYVGFSKNSRNRAEFDITPYLVRGENVVAVEVYRSSDGSFLEAQDMFRLPGIFRSVMLTSKPMVQIRDLQVVPQLSAQGAMGELHIKAEVRNLDKKRAKGYRLAYSLHELPMYQDEGASQVLASQGAEPLTLGGGTHVQSTHTLALPSPKLWTAETPHRYVLVAKLLDAKKRVVETVSLYTGFRQVEIREVPASEDEFGLAGRYFLINGKPAKLKGVNRHETHPSVGHAITRAMMHEEVMLMKRANINHVRNSHYPTDPYFYYLCDKYGIYLEDEANIESHQYYYGKESLSHVKEFDVATTNRMLEMVYANINHPSIVIWSLGNEAGPGENFVRSYDATKRVDTSRPIQYERNNAIVDMGSNQYPSIPWVQEAVKGGYKIKYPFHISEYAHSMGNAVGGLQDYWTAMESTNFFCGAAIWDWVDQSLYHHLPDGRRYMAYGGDFGDTPNDGMFVMNGIIFADRTPKPQYYEVKKVYQNVGITAEDLSAGQIRLFNKNYYTDLSDYTLACSVYEEGKQILSWTEPSLPTIAPRTSQVVAVSLPATTLDPSKEYFLKVQLLLRSDKPWAKAGYVQAEEQLLLAPKTEYSARLFSNNNSLKIKDESLRKTAPRITVSNLALEVSFDPQQGTIHSYSHAGKMLIEPGNGPKLDAFRAACDNDNWALPAWGRYGLHNLKHRTTSSEVYQRPDGAVVVVFAVESQAPNAAKIYDRRASGRYRIEEQTDKPFGPDDFKFTSTQTYTVYPDGSVELQANITSNKPKIALGRLGFELIVPKRYYKYTYYGRGPINNYSDRKTAQFVEVHHSTVADQFVHFAKPQTMGNREEVRWLTLTDDEGHGILCQAGQTMSASALPWSAKELLMAPHPHELPEAGDTHLHLDASVTGLGGNSCGQGGPLNHCRSFGATQRFSFVIRPYYGGSTSDIDRVPLEGDVAPIIVRSARGEVTIEGVEGESYLYSINGGKYQPYTGSFSLREAARISARSKRNPKLASAVNLPRWQSAPLEVVYASNQEEADFPASLLVDDNPDTFWHTTYQVTSAPFPHWVDFDAGEVVSLKGFRFLPRQGSRSGRFKDYTLSVSLDGKTWTEVLRSSMPNEELEQVVHLPSSVRARYIRLTALNNHAGNEYATGAEFSIIVD